MTKTQIVLAQRWRSLATVAALLALAGAVLWVSGRISAEVEAREQVTAEADRRGTAVSTLARDVRQLRVQLEEAGEKPKAPDPSVAVRDLPDRAAVPVPIPGPRGPKGDQGEPAPTISAADGRDGPPGAPGAPGADSTVPGPPGPQGQPGADSTVPGPQGPRGAPGEQGPAGPVCPDGYSPQPPPWDPDALVCRRAEAPRPGPSGPLGAGTLALTAAYRKL